MLIAIDGPAASGKGTIGKMVAKHFGFAYLDTGKLYRVIAHKALQLSLDYQNEEQVVKMVDQVDFENLSDPQLETEEVGKIASVTSAYKGVREKVLGIQKDFSLKEPGAVLDGRDIGTIVCPNADFKFFITGDVEIRAQRRYKQLQNKDYSVIYRAILDDLRARDERDQRREASPLKPASDAIVIDTSDSDISQVFGKVISVIEGSKG